MSQYNIIVKFKLVCKSKTTKKLVLFYCLRFHRNTNKKTIKIHKLHTQKKKHSLRQYKSKLFLLIYKFI